MMWRLHLIKTWRGVLIVFVVVLAGMWLLATYQDGLMRGIEDWQQGR